MKERRVREWPREVRFIDDATYLHESEQRFGVYTYNIGSFRTNSGRRVIYLNQQRKTDQFVPISNHPSGGDFMREQGATIAGYAIRKGARGLFGFYSYPSWQCLFLFGFNKIEVIPEDEHDTVKQKLLEHYKKIGTKSPLFVDFW